MADLLKTGDVAGTPNPAAALATPAPQPAAVVKPAVAPAVAKPAEPPTSGDKTVPLAALQEEREKRQQLAQELENLKTKVNQYQQPQQYQQQADPAQAIRQEVEKLWETDPKKAVQAEILMGLTWLDSVNSYIDNQIDSIAAKDPSFGQYQGQVRQYIKSLPLEQRGQPGVVDLALSVVRGNNVDSIVERTKEELYRKFQSGELAASGVSIPSAGTFSQPPRPQGVQLSDEQIRVAGAMGMTPEDYAKYVKVR